MVKNTPLGWAITGLGNHVEQRVAGAFDRAADTRLAAVHSRSLDKGRDFANRHGAPRVYDSFEQMLKDPAVNAVYVATPNSLHAGQTVLAARAGKHILCEKPMALSVADCERMISACRENGVKLGVVFQNRYHPAHIEARRLVQSGEVGQIGTVRVEYGNGVLKKVLKTVWRGNPEMAGAGAVYATGLHPIDLVRFLLDAEIEEVSAWCEPAPPQIDDTDYVNLKLSNGVYATVLTGFVPRCENDAVIYGEKARITCKNTVGMAMQGDLLVEGDGINIKTPYHSDHPDSASYIKVIEAFNRSILDNRRPDVTGEDGLQMCKVGLAVLESARTGKTVKVSNIT